MDSSFVGWLGAPSWRRAGVLTQHCGAGSYDCRLLKGVTGVVGFLIDTWHGLVTSRLAPIYSTFDLMYLRRGRLNHNNFVLTFTFDTVTCTLHRLTLERLQPD